MSRSRKSQPYTVGAGCRSQKRGKRVCNRKFRRQERRAILSGRWDSLPYRQIEVMDSWDLGGDGSSKFCGISATTCSINSRLNEFSMDSIARVKVWMKMELLHAI